MIAEQNPVLSVVGYDALTALINEFGGLTITIPDGVCETYRQIEKIIGPEKTRALVDYAGGCRLYIPKSMRQDRDERDAAIATDYQGGATIRQLAIKYKLCDRSIYKIIERQALNNSGAAVE